MSSLLRRIQRRVVRKRPDYVVPDRPYRLHADGVGYDVLHPTKGWQSFCAKRVAYYAGVR